MKLDISKKRLIDFNGIKGGIAKKSLWLNQRMFLKNLIKTGNNAFGFARDLSSFGESGFFSTTMYGWALRKSLL